MINLSSAGKVTGHSAGRSVGWAQLKESNRIGRILSNEESYKRKIYKKFINLYILFLSRNMAEREPAKQKFKWWEFEWWNAEPK